MAKKDEEIRLQQYVERHKRKVVRKDDDLPWDGERVQKAITKMKKMNQKLQEKVGVLNDMLVQKTGKSLKELHTYASNPQNFSKVQWEKLEKERRIQEEKLRGLFQAFGVDYGKMMQERKKKQLAQKGRKQLAARKKWIPVR